MPVEVAEYANWMKSWGAADTTIAARVTLATGRMTAWGGVAGFTTGNVQAFLGTDGWSRWTLATYHGHLKSYCEFLVTAGYIDENPLDDMRKVRRPRSLPKPLNDAEMTLVLERGGEHGDGRVLDWITLARRAGLRCHEIAKFRGSDLTDQGLYVLGKGGKEALLPIHPEIGAMAVRYATSGWWFPSRQGGHLDRKTLSTTVSRFFDGLGIQGSIHRVRHNFGTDLLRGGNNIRIVQQLMRHSSLETTAVYTAVGGDELSAAIGRLPAA